MTVSADAGLTRRAIVQRGAAAVMGMSAMQLLAACGGGGSGTGTTGGGTAALQLVNFSTSTPDAGLGLGYITAGKAYEKVHPGTTVTFRAFPFAEFVPSVTSAARAGQLGSNVALLPALNDQAIFPALRPLTAADAGPLATELSGWMGARVDVANDGSYAGLPWGGQGIIWYYNKKLFEQAGLDPDVPPSTFDDLARACEALRAKGITPLAMSGSDGFGPWWMFSSWLPQFYPTQDDVTAFATGKSSFNDPRVRGALDAVAETYKRGWWEKSWASKTYPDVQSEFGAGKAGIVCGIITTIVNWAIWDETLGKDGYGVFSGPVLENAVAGKTPLGFGPSLLLGVSKKAANFEAALAFNKYLASKEGQTIMLAKGGSFPNRTDIDVATVAGSPGAAAIADLVKRMPLVDTITNWLNSAAYAKALPLLGAAVASNGLGQYVSEVSRLQAG